MQYTINSSYKKNIRDSISETKIMRTSIKLNTPKVAKLRLLNRSFIAHLIHVYTREK